MAKVLVNAVVEDRTLTTDALVIYILGSRVPVAILPKGTTMTPALSRLISEEWAKPKYSCSHPVPMDIVISLIDTL